MSTTTDSADPQPARTYGQAIEALNTLQSNAATIEAIRKSGGRLNEYGIPEMIEYLERIGYKPDDLNALNVIHITGTKGKGSTSAFCDSLFRELDPKGEKKVGLYTSPHMVAVRERIRINGLPIAEDVFARYFWEIWDRLGQNASRRFDFTPLRPIYFRFLTLLALHIFLQEGVSATILEVGIGGKYDSTNIVPKPVVTAVSQLGLDHTALLGNTVEEIAVQKAGIFKPGVVALSWKGQPGGSLDKMADVASQVGTRLELVDLHPEIVELDLGLRGDHQRTNASLAVEIMNRFVQSEVGKSEFGKGLELANGTTTSLDDAAPVLQAWQRSGLEKARWPGRCQVVPTKHRFGIEEEGTAAAAASNTNWFLDGAHTVDSLSLCSSWFVQAERESGGSAPGGRRRRMLVFNCTNGRSAPELLGAVLESLEASLEEAAKADEKLTAERVQETLRFPRARAYFDKVVFCTNVTYADGGSASDLTSKTVDANDLASLTVQRELKEAWEELLGGGESNSKSQVLILASIEEAIKLAYEEEPSNATTSSTTNVLVTGSLHLVGGVMAHLKDSNHLDERLLSVL
ncbi:FolC bifunctional protein [Violaceomyces palustris]|uniref:FolC bifunctional protein n=1 Tax=Violaceomyces palustris TaxID=1673888 RepID=A0ACD0NNY7_9BASI|nr:FolC bifunctional protein [Violaceomyces palustris]